MIPRSISLAIILSILLQCARSSTLDDMTLMLSNMPEDGRLQFPELANKYGYKCDTYNVTTDDRYILTLYNIPGDTRRPVYLQHGFEDSADTFLLRTNTSLVAFLVEHGYDVWLGNMRGNKYSRAHESLLPDDLQFWEFSVHEAGTYDLPAMIDFVLKHTGQKQLQAIGHSEGTTVFFVMGAQRPEYNDKVKLVICLSPVAYLHHSSPPLFPLISLVGGPAASAALSVAAHGDLLKNSSVAVDLIKVACTQKLLSYEVCAEGVFFTAVGRDSEQFEPEFLPIAIGHYPCGSSVKTGAHFLQIAARKKFAQYDYGLAQNKLKYGSLEPPLYDLSKVKMKIALVVGKADTLTAPKDLQLLRKQLPDVVNYHVMDWEKWNHFDMVWGKYMYVFLFNHIHEMLTKYYV
ncbi:lipase 1-like [Anticarsia gemmatalis]|uniref:lipase 1-like n=1 Tax=Anticarsia gemmatalis TaxID=129554 RepID=UPI003F75B8B6